MKNTSHSEPSQTPWMNRALLPDFKNKLLQTFNNEFRFMPGQDNSPDLPLADFDIVFFVDFDFNPVTRLHDESCAHALKVTATIQQGKLISYTITGSGKAQFFACMLPQNETIKKA